MQFNEIKAGFRKVHMRAFYYSVRDMNSRQMLAYALYRIQLKSAVVALFAYSIFVFSLSLQYKFISFCAKFLGISSKANKPIIVIHNILLYYNIH